MSLKEIMTFEDQSSISFVESLLRGESIRFLVAGTDYLPTTIPQLLVHEDDIDRARSLLIQPGFEARVYSEKRIKNN